MTSNKPICGQFLVPEKLNVKSLGVLKSFEALSDKDKKYAHYMSKASWCGAPIVSKQVSPESYQLVSFFIRLFRESPPQKVRDHLNNRFLEDEINGFLNYVGMLFANSGNYLSFGDKKFIPRISQDIFSNILGTLTSSNYDNLVINIYLLSDNVKILNYYPHGVTSYYSPNMTKKEVEIVNEYMTANNIEHWNTRIEKYDQLEKQPLIIIKVASSDIKYDMGVIDYKGLCITKMTSDYNKELEGVISWLKEANKYTRNDHQKRMLTSYIEHFTSGDIDKHKDSQRSWIQDIEPPIETNMGFIENYRDPSGVRSEFQSFVSIVDVETSKRFKEMVDNAVDLIATLPWPKEFEKDEFIKPDFTSLEVITFVGSGIPAGINIPNYDDIRQRNGFKNVSLGNIIRLNQGSNSDEKTNFLNSEDDVLYKKYNKNSFITGVASHELLGHGSGKLFYKMNNGVPNFNKDTINPITNGKVICYYNEGETWSSKFGQTGSAYEESRAEAVGLFYSVNPIIQKIFGHEKDNHTMYISWLSMIRAGLIGLEKGYNLEQGKWVQAHCQARYVIYRVMCEIPNFVNVELKEDVKADDFIISINRSMIVKEGLDKLKEYMIKLQVYKSTGNSTDGLKMFNKYSIVDDYHIKLREIMISKSKPRTSWIQPTTYFDTTNKVQIKDYSETVDGLITSFCENYVLTTNN